MRTNSFVSIALGVAALIFASSAGATSVSKARPHDPDLACTTTKQLVADLNAEKPYGEDRRNFRMYFTDEMGFVEHEQLDQFTKSMVSANGKRDRNPMRLQSLYRLHVDDSRALYLAGFLRYSWALKRYVTNGLLDIDEIDDPHWEPQTTYWLLGFRTNDIVTMREAGDAYMLTSDSNRVKGC